MKKTFNARETFGHKYWTSIDEQLNHWENEPYEAMMEMEIAEQVEEEKAHRSQAYLAIAEKLYNEMEGARAEYEGARQAYESWTEVCAQKGIY